MAKSKAVLIAEILELDPENGASTDQTVAELEVILADLSPATDPTAAELAALEEKQAADLAAAAEAAKEAEVAKVKEREDEDAKTLAALAEDDKTSPRVAAGVTFILGPLTFKAGDKIKPADLNGRHDIFNLHVSKGRIVVPS